MMNIFEHILSLFFPRLCVACQIRLHASELHICLSCLAQLPKTDYHNQPDNLLESTLAGRFAFRRAAAFAYFVKEGSVQQIVHELKYKNNPDLGLYMGQLCGHDLFDSSFIQDIDLLVPVPLHPKRQKQRGYNQSNELAKGIAAITGKAIDNTTLIRAVNNPSQTKNSKEQRWKNVENIFSITNDQKFSNKHILLIDDVVTTGSTLEACAKEILKCRGTRVSIYALAVAT